MLVKKSDHYHDFIFCCSHKKMFDRMTANNVAAKLEVSE